MSEYPWDIENMMLGQHDQPCDCAICDEIWYNREVRRNRRKNTLDEVTRLKIALDVAERQRDAKWVETGLQSEMRRNDLLNADIKRLQQDLCMWQEMYKEIEVKLNAQQQKCNIYKCMERKDLKLHIENLQKKVKELEQQLDRIACGYWNETACHSISREALKAIRGRDD